MRYGLTKNDYITFEEAEEVLDIATDANLSGWATSYCPSHSDSRPSLGIKEDDYGKLIVYCYAGCNAKDVFREIRRLLEE